MQDYLAQIEKLRKDAAECARIRDLATDQAKRQVFDRLANHLTVLADQVEMAMLERKRAGGWLRSSNLPGASHRQKMN